MNFSVNPLLAGFLILEWVVRIIMLFSVPKRRKPSSANAWLLLIMIFPTVGAILFYMFGNPKLPKTRRKRRRDMDDSTTKELDALRKKDQKIFAKLDNDDHSTLSKLAEVLGGMPVMGGNKVELLSDYQGSLDELVREIDKARHYIHIEYFIASYDHATAPVFEAIKNATDRGVKVRFLYDKVVSVRYKGHQTMKQMLNVSGADYREMLPLNLLPGKNFTRPDLRNHRKIVVIDGKVAFSGSQNLIDRRYRRKDGIYYEEIVLKMHGPIVWQFNNIFRTDWYAETKQSLAPLVEEDDVPSGAGDVMAQLLPSGPTHDHDNNLKFYTSMVHAAKKRVGIVVPYFIPDESFLDALTAAAQRGVKVTMINSEAIDKLLAGHAQRSYYEELLEAGVDVFLYKKPIFLHTKQVLIDDEVAIVGSSNLDIRSFELDLEITTIIYDKKVASKLEKIEKKYLERSKKITAEKWLKRSTKNKLLDNVARLTAALQ